MYKRQLHDFTAETSDAAFSMFPFLPCAIVVFGLFFALAVDVYKRQVLAPFQFVPFSLEATEQVLQVGAAGQESVSYTHLDVYKRQTPMCGAGAARRHRLTVPASLVMC